MVSSERHHDDKRNRAQLWALFALIVYTPLPLASDRPWALGMLCLLTGCLLLWTLWNSDRSLKVEVWQGAKIPLVLLGMWMMLLMLQLIPLHADWLHWLDKRALSGFDVRAGDSLSIDTYSTRLYLAKACVLSVVFWLILNLVNSRSRIKLLLNVIVFSGLTQALVGVLLMATGTTYQLFFTPIIDVRGHGTFVSPNHFAGYLELTLAVGIGAMIAKLDGRSSASMRQRMHGWMALLLSEKAVLRLSLIIMVVGLVASRSRMGNSAFFASLLIVGMFAIVVIKYTLRKSADKRGAGIANSMILFIMSLIIIDVVIVGGVVGVEKVVQRIQNTNLQEHPQIIQSNVVDVSNGQRKLPDVVAPKVWSEEESVEQRSKVARSSIQIVRDFPLFGTGGGTFHLSYPHYRPAKVYGYVDHTHNDYVEFASDTGLLGVFLLVSIVMHSVWRSVKQLVNSQDQLMRGMAFASLMGVTSLLIHAWVDFNFQNPANAMLFLILLSFPYLQKNNKRKNLVEQKN